MVMPPLQTGRLSAKPETLFVYGTLMFPEILRVLIGRVPESTTATAAGWRVAALPGRIYPALVPGDATAQGRLLTGIAPGEWQVIDAFEDPMYDLRRLTLTTGQKSWTYAATDPALALPYAWDMAAFTAQLPAYLTRIETWRAR
jgi:gamma-glutamylcyclotransferase (GGCT)/AIG2-like uncharacterized protein YtfP